VHPVIRFLCLIVLAAGLARAGWAALLVGGAALVLLYVHCGWQHAQSAWKVIWRLRFLLLSLAVLYLWFTPGAPILPAAGAFAPTWEGLEQGALRALALLLLMALVQLYLATSEREELLSAIYWWARPLRVLGLLPERLALRMVLTLEALPHLQDLLSAPRPSHGGRWERLSAAAAGLFVATLAAAERAECHAVQIVQLEAPPAWQWLWPVGCGGVFFAL
jgi:energy-coupling factor transporter transmembrane protein EcfT